MRGSRSQVDDKHNLAEEKNTPDFLEYMSEDALKAIKPKAGSMIR
jgi:hypothetical protein